MNTVPPSEQPSDETAKRPWEIAWEAELERRRLTRGRQQADWEAAQRCALMVPVEQRQKGYCDWCGTQLTGRQRRWCAEHSDAWAEHHNWGFARDAAARRDGFQCVICGAGDPIEVNHIDPRVGQGYHIGCHHHLDNLETLCRPCHVQVTTEQKRQRQSERQS